MLAQNDIRLLLPHAFDMQQNLAKNSIRSLCYLPNIHIVTYIIYFADLGIYCDTKLRNAAL